MLAKYQNITFNYNAQICFKICGKSRQVKIDLGESVFQLLTQMGERGSILSVHTGFKEPFTNWSVWLGQTKELSPTDKTLSLQLQV